MHYPVDNMDLSPTRTVFASTAVVTKSVDCRGCKALCTTNIGGLGPVRSLYLLILQFFFPYLFFDLQSLWGSLRVSVHFHWDEKRNGS